MSEVAHHGKSRPQPYHHGQTIREFRRNRKMTLLELAERWPTGRVSERNVQSVEAGEKHITDQDTLRGLADMLQIPLWRFGLSDYNPFVPQQLPGRGERMYNETLDVIDLFIDRTWYMRRTAPVPETLINTQRLVDLFASLSVSLPPTAHTEKRFLRLYAQVQRLHAIMLIEQQRYAEALLAFSSMYRTARELDEPGTLALALMGMGTELERAGRQQDAIKRLEEARDASFGASRQVAALVNAYLARAYASDHDARRFYRAIDTAQQIATNLGSAYGSGHDYVFHRLSGILAERSYGYLEIGEPKKVLEMRDEIQRQIDATNNTWLHAWIPLDWARSYLALGEIEQSVKEGRTFFERARLLHSPHALSRAYQFLHSLEHAGFHDLPAVRAFREELLVERKHLDEADAKN